MNKKGLLFIFLGSNLMIILVYFLISGVQNRQVVEAIEGNFRKVIAMEVQRITLAVKNELLLGNIRAARNNLAQMVEGSFVKDFSIVGPESGQTQLPVGEEGDSFVISVPVEFRMGGVVWGHVHYLVSNRPTAEIRSRIDRNLWWNTLVLWIFYSTILAVIYIYIWNSMDGISLFIRSKFSDLEYTAGVVTKFLWGPLMNTIEITSTNYIENRKRIDNLKRQESLFKVAKKVAHDIRSPVGALRAIINKDGGLPDAQRSILEKVYARITQLAENLLDDARAQSGKLTPIGHLKSWIEDLLAEKRITFPDAQFSVVLEFSESGKILVDEFGFKRILSNLINNSVEASRGSALIEISTQCREGYFIMTVSDQGCGMEEAKIELALQGAFTSKGQGNAIGLSSARSLVETWGGSFKIQSTPGKGTTITISFSINRGEGLQT